MAKITAIIPTFNEEDSIQRALDSVQFADEIIVIDSYSTDRTVEIVRRSNAVLLQRKFDDFSSQKNFAIQHATYDWVFLLDADEEVPQHLEKEIVEKTNETTEEKAFYIYRKFFFKDKKLNYSGWQRDKVIRLFRKEFSTYQGKVHEEIVVQGKLGYLKNKINHYSYVDYERYKSKLKKYAHLQAEELYDKKSFVTLFHLLLKPPIRFLIQFFWKRGFLDGVNGFVICYLHAYGVFRRYWELFKLKQFGYAEKKVDKNHLIIGYEAKRVYHNTTGLGNYSRDLIQILSDYYPNNQYVLFNPKPKKVDRLLPSSSIKEVLPKAIIWKKLTSIWRQSPVIKQVVEEGVDVFHGLSGEIPLGISSVNIKKVVTIHDLIFIRYPKLYSWESRKIYFEKFKYAAKKADIVVAISEQTKRDIISFLKIPGNKIRVIYQGCHSVFKKEISEKFKQEVREKYSLPPEYLLNVGTIEERKNLESLVEAIKEIEIPLVVVGKKTKYIDRIKKIIAQNQMQNRVFFIEGGTMEELAAIYKMAKIFVYPSIFEGFGIPIIEALYSKTPVITTASGVFPEAGGEYSTYLKNPKDVEEIREAIENLLNSDEKRKEMAEKGFKFVQKFNDENIAQQMMELYQELVRE